MRIKIYITVIVLLAFMPFSSLACSCVKFPLPTKWDMSKNVFLALITHTEEISPGHTRGYFKVKEVFKGTAEKIPYISAYHSLGFCGKNIEQGESYYVFAEEDGPIEYDMCSLTARVGHNSYDKELLEKLVNDEIPRKYEGVYRVKDDSLAIGRSLDTVNVKELRLYDHEYYKVKFKGYELSDGSVMAVEVAEKEPATGSQYQELSGEVQFKRVFLSSGTNHFCGVIERYDNSVPPDFTQSSIHDDDTEADPNLRICRGYLQEQIQFCEVETAITQPNVINSCRLYKREDGVGIETTVLVNETAIDEPSITTCVFRCIK